jgi:invasion protein IalB
MSMIELSRKLAIGASLLAFSVSTGFAQDAAAPTAPPAQSAATTSTGDAPAGDTASDDLSMGQEAGANTPPAPKTQETANVGETYVQSTSEAWEQRCIKTQDGSDPCQVYQLLRDGQGTAVSEFTMFPLPTGSKAAAGATVIVPLETLLPANLQLQIDGAKAKVYPYTFCTQIGCVARIGFTGEELAQLKKGNKATLTLVPAAAPDQKVQLDISLKGFTKGFDSLPVPKAK